MGKEEQKYLSFLAYCINEQSQDVPDIGSMDWRGLYQFCIEQAIVGIVLSGIDRLTKSINLDIHKDLLYEWIGQANMIESRNKLVNRRLYELTDYLKQQGQVFCVLKGQGNAAMYPNSYARTPGDIDVWLKGTKKEVVDFVHSRYPDMLVQYHHMTYPIFNDIEVELHYYPSFSYNFLYNNRLQKFFADNSEEQFNNINKEGYSVPTKLFNLVFQLSHMMRHFFTQGIGLRHAIDYYFLLKQGISNEEEVELIGVLKNCGLYKFFLSIIWIERMCLGLDVDYKLISPNIKGGKMILREMIKGGNFGKQYTHQSNSIIRNYFNQFLYNMQYVMEFPVEPLSRPIALSYDYIRRHIFKQL